MKTIELSEDEFIELCFEDCVINIYNIVLVRNSEDHSHLVANTLFIGEYAF